MLGVDLSDLSVKIIDIEKRGGQLRVGAFNNEDLPEHALQQGEIKNVQLVSKTIKKAIKEAANGRPKLPYVVASLPEIKAFLRVINIQDINNDNLEQALKIEIEQHIPYKLNEVVLDSIITNQTSKTAEILVAAVPKKIVQGYISSLECAGLTPVVLEIESIATARSLIKNSLDKNQTNKPEAPVTLIIDLGSKYTSFIIYDRQIVRFSKTVNIASFKFTESLSKALGLSFDKAEKEKRKWGMDLKAHHGKLYKTLRPLIDELITETKGIIDFYENRHLGNNITKVLLTGGSSNLKGLDAYMSLKMSRSVIKGNPWLNLTKKSDKGFVPPIPKGKSLNFSTAIGLSLRGLDFEFSEIN